MAVDGAGVVADSIVVNAAARHTEWSGEYARMVKPVDDSWEERRWLRRHVTFAPFGIFTATLLLACWLSQWEWQGKATWELAAGQVDLGAVVYAMVAVLAERGVRLMFWAWDQRKKWRAQMRAEARAEGLAEGREAGREEGRAKTAQRYDTWLAKVAEERGIELAELLPPEESPR